MSFMHPYEWQNAQIIARQHLAAQLQQHASQAQAPHHLAAPQPQPPPSHQLEQPIGSSKRAASPTFESNKNKSTRRESPPPPTVEPVARTRFDYKVFRTANTTLEQTKEWVRKFPALKKRNFYIIANHHASAKHYDLRLQLDSSTTSWAIPKGFSNFKSDELRLAIETNVHPMSCTLHEGEGFGTTGVWDVGTYKILPTKAAQKKKRELLNEGFDDGTTTGEDDEPEDYKQEDKFAEAYYRASFQNLPSRHGIPGFVNKSDNGNFRAFVVELNGQRYQNLQLNFAHRTSDRSMGLYTYMPDHVRRNWMIRLQSPSYIDLTPSLGSVSLLTGRTMSQIKADREKEREFIEGRKEARVLHEVMMRDLKEEWGLGEEAWEEVEKRLVGSVVAAREGKGKGMEKERKKGVR